MAIQVRCPNGACGKRLSVGDDYAGRTGKCPSCGAAVQIPQLHGGGHYTSPPADSPSSLNEPRTVYPEGSSRPTGEPEAYGGPAGSRQPWEGDRKTYGRPGRPGDLCIGTLVCLAVAGGLLLLLTFVPIFSMFGVSVPATEEFRRERVPSIGGMIKLTEGVLYLVITILVTGFVITGMVLYLTIPERVSRIFVTVAGCVGAGWSLTLFLWTGAFIWDIFAASGWLKVNERGVGIYPGIGLWLGLVASLGAGVVSIIPVCLRGRPVWLSVGLGGGFLLGVLLFTVNVQPWSQGISRKEANEFRGREKDIPMPKFYRRYAPLATEQRVDRLR